MTFRLLFAIAAIGFMGLGACTSSGEIDNIVLRKATWASFLSGEDIAKNCGAGAGDAYRLTYFGNRADQVRIYDLRPSGPGWQLRSRVLEAAVEFRSMTAQEVMALPNPVDRTVPLQAGPAGQIADRVADAMAAGGVPVGERIFSASYFWLAAVCRDGQFRFAAWDYPDRGMDHVTFAGLLFEFDPTTIPVEQPKGDGRITPVTYTNRERERDAFEHYELVVKNDGVVFGRMYPLE